MSQAPDYFTDLLGADEPLEASIGGYGPTVKKAVGDELVWIQLAVTSTRMAAVKLVQPALGGGYRPAFRLVVDKASVRIRKFPRTDRSPARLELLGFGEPLELVDIDDKAVFPAVEPFLVAWGGKVEGQGEVRVREPDPYEQPPAADTKKLFLVMAAGMLLLGVCACLVTAAVALRQLLGSL